MAKTMRPVIAAVLALGVLAVQLGSSLASRRVGASHDRMALYQRLKHRQMAATAPYPAARYFQQDQDHFDGTNTNTWQQAYFVNDQYWVPNSSAPVFICVGGEGPPLDGSAVVNSVHCNDAVDLLPQSGALLVALEHRYYGCHNMSACPVSSFTPSPSNPAPYRFLSSRQALADLAAFREYLVHEFSAYNSPFVSFGGSYPGMLAGWFRTKFPHLVHAAVSSSAPVIAQVDMFGYNNIVASAFTVSDNNVGGSPACSGTIAAGHARIGELFNTDVGRQRLVQLFGQSAGWYADRNNQLEFAGYGVADFPAQSNDPSCTQPSCNIGLICQVMLDTTLGDEVARLATVRKQQTSWLPSREQLVASLTLISRETASQGVTAHVNRQRLASVNAPSRDDVMAATRFIDHGLRALSSVTDELETKGHVRVLSHEAVTEEGSEYAQLTDLLDSFWYYQTCTEFAFYQTCEVGSQCFYTQGLDTLDVEIAMCPSQFGVPVNKVQANVDYTNAYYGADHPAASCVLYVNGEVDPWHALSINKSPSPSLQTLWVPGASHHAWTHPDAPSDQPSVISARQTIRDFVLSSLNQSCLQAAPSAGSMAMEMKSKKAK